MLGRHVVFAFVGVGVGVHIFTSQYVRNYLSDCLEILHTTPPGGLDVYFGVTVGLLWPTIGSVLWPNFSHFDFPICQELLV